MDGFVTSLLTMAAYQLPELLAAAAALAMLRIWGASGAPGRKLAVAGALVILAASLLRLGVAVFQTWLIYRANEHGMGMAGTGMALVSAMGMLLSVASAAGLGLLGWGAAKAMAGYRALDAGVP